MIRPSPTEGVGPGETLALTVAYRSRGLDRWTYRLGPEVAQVRDFTLVVETDFKDVDFPARTLSPTAKEETPDGWRLTWRHENLISGFEVGVEMPHRLNPGPLAAKVSFFAPVCLLFFFFVIFVLSVLRNVNLHPMHYFFLAAAFFSFHLLFAYLVDHIDLHLAFAIAAATSVALVVSYLRVVVGPRFAFVEAGLAQLVYLVLFSYTQFLKGFTGLAVTVASVLTLFVLMQATARVDWEKVFAGQEHAAAGKPATEKTPVESGKGLTA
ncbi:MAG: inner membrane CreD family protein [Firmicutes bacterium]|nr:inner membrane CreD family protein [Bacillota bacterium]